jgi:hypothetical protein
MMITRSINSLEETKMTDPVNVIVIRDDLVYDNYIRETNEEAEELFLILCNKFVPGYEDYTERDREVGLENGYEEFPGGSVCISHPMTVSEGIV